MSTYRKKPVVIEAVRWTGDNQDEVIAFTSAKFEVTDPEDRENSSDPDATAAVFDELHSTWVLVYDGDWIIRGVRGEFYPCKPDIFRATYEPVTQ